MQRGSGELHHHLLDEFLTGFLTVVNGKAVVHGRPCGLLQVGPDSFLLTDDHLGLVYAIYPQTSKAKHK